MGKHANFAIVEDTARHLLIRDIGPWNVYPTVTNDAEEVVKKLAPILGDRRLFYFDSEGELDELLVNNGHFAGFAVVDGVIP
jgi:hypothetical protein